MREHRETPSKLQESFSEDSRVVDDSEGSRTVKGHDPLALVSLSAPSGGSLGTSFFPVY